jgi:hypothetical protein
VRRVSGAGDVRERRTDQTEGAAGGPLRSMIKV